MLQLNYRTTAFDSLLQCLTPSMSLAPAKILLMQAWISISVDVLKTFPSSVLPLSLTFCGILPDSSKGYQTRNFYTCFICTLMNKLLKFLLARFYIHSMVNHFHQVDFLNTLCPRHTLEDWNLNNSGQIIAYLRDEVHHLDSFLYRPIS